MKNIDTGSFNLLRFIAAIIVVIFHYGKDTFLGRSTFLISGPEMVTFFFVLSGYIMCFSTDRKEHFNIKDYYLARCKRIFPAYFFALLLCFLSPYIANKFYFYEFIFMQSWVFGDVLYAPINPPGWSISVEVFFYLSFPFFSPLFKRLSIQKSILIAFSLWFLTQVINIYLLNKKVCSINKNPNCNKYIHDFVYFFPLSHLSSFILGIASYKITLKLSKGNYHKILTTPLFLIASITMFFIINSREFSIINNLIIPTAGSFLGIFFALFLITISFNRNYFSNVLNRYFFTYLGKISYNIYIFQLPVFLYFYNDPFIEKGFFKPFFILIILLIIFEFLLDISKVILKKRHGDVSLS